MSAQEKLVLKPNEWSTHLQTNILSSSIMNTNTTSSQRDFRGFSSPHNQQQWNLKPISGRNINKKSIMSPSSPSNPRNRNKTMAMAMGLASIKAQESFLSSLKGSQTRVLKTEEEQQVTPKAYLNFRAQQQNLQKEDQRAHSMTLQRPKELFQRALQLGVCDPSLSYKPLRTKAPLKKRELAMKDGREDEIYRGKLRDTLLQKLLKTMANQSQNQSGEKQSKGKVTFRQGLRSSTKEIWSTDEPKRYTPLEENMLNLRISTDKGQYFPTIVENNHHHNVLMEKNVFGNQFPAFNGMDDRAKMTELISVKKVETSSNYKPNKRYVTPKTRVLVTEEAFREEKTVREDRPAREEKVMKENRVFKEEKSNGKQRTQRSFKKIKRDMVRKDSFEQLAKSSEFRLSDPVIFHQKMGTALEKELALQHGKSDKLEGWDSEWNQQGSPVPFWKF